MTTQYTINEKYIGLMGRNNGESIILRIGKDISKNCNSGFIVVSINADTIGSYGNNWVNDFNTKIEYKTLSDKVKNIVDSIITKNFSELESEVINMYIGKEHAFLNVTVSGDVIDVDNFIIFNIKEVKLIRYSSMIIIVFKDGSVETLPLAKNVIDTLKEAYINNRKKYI